VTKGSDGNARVLAELSAILPVKRGAA
jgi:hypothetical protein